MATQRRKREVLELEPLAPAPKVHRPSSRYVPEFVYESIGGVVAAHGPRRAYANAKRLVRDEQIEFGLVLRRSRAAPANHDQVVIPLPPLPALDRREGDHAVLYDVRVANWTSEPDGLRLVNPPKERPPKVGNKSKSKTPILSMLADAGPGKWISYEELRIALDVSSPSMSRTVKHLLRDRLVRRFRDGHGRVWLSIP